MTDGYSIDTGQKQIFGTVDYVLFSLMFCASAAIGFYHVYKDRNKKKTEDFHLGGRNMHPIPVSISLSATFLSSLTILGIPSEVFTNGTMLYWIIVAMFIAIAGAAHVFLPIFYNLNKISCFQYLELRFGKVTRTIVSAIYLLQTLVYIGLVVYAPSLAFEAVTGVSLWGCMIGVTAVCTLYTALGGLKTVLWTDSLQFSIMIAGLFAVLIEGSKATGGFSNAWKIADENDRIKFDDFSFDPKTRHSVWTVAIGGSFFWLYLYGVNQAQIQLACSLPTLRRAQAAMWLRLPGVLLIITLTILIGIVMFAFYSQCHPVAYGIINRNDQMLPLFVLDTLGTIPGLSGIFIACVFSAGLSTISAGLNAMSAILLEDFVKPFCCRYVVKKNGILLSKFLVVCIGVVQLAVTVMLSEFKGLIMQFSISLFSITAGPILGLFVAGMIFPWTNTYGARVGFLVSIVFTCWLGVGTLVEKPSGYIPLSTYTIECNWTAVNKSRPTTTITQIVSGSTTTTEEPVLHDFYRTSYFWYIGFGMIVCVIVSLFTSFITGYTKPNSLDSRLICPIFDVIFPFLPESFRKPLRFGVIYDRNKNDGENGVSLEEKDISPDCTSVKEKQDTVWPGVDNQAFTHL